MPWDKNTIQEHNHKLKGKSAEKAAAQANAILEKTNDEGLALAVANKNAKKSRADKISNMYKKKSK